MDDLYMALSHFRRRNFEQCIEYCTKLLLKNSLDQAAWVLKMNALKEQVYVDDLEDEEEGMAEMLLDENAIAQIARPGTSLKVPGTSSGGTSQAIRPRTQSGRPVSGVVRPGTLSGRTLEQAMKAPRTAYSSRPITSSSGRFLRLGTASMLSTPDGPFIDVAHLNISKYAANPTISKSLFEYLYYHDNDVRNALRLAVEATQINKFKDWWWKVQLGKCYYRLGLLREAENQFKSALNQQVMIETAIWLGKVYVKMDQPLNSLEVYKDGLKIFPNDTTLLVACARIQEGLNDIGQSVKLYKDVLQYDAVNVEAMACIATHHFYSDQPEVALRFYRRLLQMGVHNTEVYTNLGLCCFFAQQYDLTMTCFQKALSLASPDNVADVWYNLSHIAMGIGDVNLATQCLNLALVHDNNHAESYNNLGALEWNKGNIIKAKALFQTAANLADHMFESHYNLAFLNEKQGDVQTSLVTVKKSLNIFPDHMPSQQLRQQLNKCLASL